jgi:hypothetical protein
MSRLIAENLKEFANLKVGDLFEGEVPALITINQQTTIQQCLEVMRNHKILSVPCVNENNEILGVIDIYEIVAVCTFLLFLGFLLLICLSILLLNPTMMVQIPLDQLIGHFLHVNFLQLREMKSMIE